MPQPNRPKAPLPILFLLLALAASPLSAQDYNQALGLRVGRSPELTYTRFLGFDRSEQVVVSFERGGLQLTALKQFHHPIFMAKTDQLFLFYGIGGHFGYATIGFQEFRLNGDVFLEEAFSVGFGLDLNLGLEFRLTDMPLAAGFDLRPLYELRVPFKLRQDYGGAALFLKYTF